VDAADYTVWRNTLGINTLAFIGADGDGDGTIDQDDFLVWKEHYGETVPVPAAGAAAAQSVPDDKPLTAVGQAVPDDEPHSVAAATAPLPPRQEVRQAEPDLRDAAISTSLDLRHNALRRRQPTSAPDQRDAALLTWFRRWGPNANDRAVDAGAKVSGLGQATDDTRRDHSDAALDAAFDELATAVPLL
jgi:hypothetical protein